MTVSLSQIRPIIQIPEWEASSDEKLLTLFETLVHRFRENLNTAILGELLRDCFKHVL
eukprot:COSAG02_NODE_2188_length_9569_cov_21.824710_12_plen_58_part_00